jgi:glyoxylase-like metal-dependent hydrolase (beta-lactamase superfamily II)
VQVLAKGCPNSYAVLPGGVPNVRYDMAGFTDIFWDGSQGGQRIRFLHTPGHGPNACSVVLDHAGKQVAFCGDAAYAGATLWQPFHLEWDHWTGVGVLAAWEGVVRLQGIGVDVLCPSHGPVIDQNPRAMLKKLADRVLDLYLAKGQISPGENDEYVVPELLACGARRVLPSLYQFGMNGYLLRAANGAALVVDPFSEDMPALRPTVTTATHYHFDHCDAIPDMQKRFGARAVLHPWLAEPLRHIHEVTVPWLPLQPIMPDEVWPERHGRGRRAGIVSSWRTSTGNMW